MLTAAAAPLVGAFAYLFRDDRPYENRFRIRIEIYYTYYIFTFYYTVNSVASKLHVVHWPRQKQEWYSIIAQKYENQPKYY